MTYIIENANLYKQNQLIKTSLLVGDGKILSVQPSFTKYRYMKMDTDNFLMTSTHVFYANGLPQGNETPGKNHFIQQYINKGCTTVIISTNSIQYAYEIKETVEKIKEVYEKSPLDYTVVVKVPIEAFSVQFVQKCKREKIPAILVEFNDPRQLYRIPWGWIREAIFPYNCPIIPVVDETMDEKKRGKLLDTWKTILVREKIPHIDRPLREGVPIPLETLKRMGIYPMKGYLQAGGELSYNLYLPKDNSQRDQIIDISSLEPVITVHKGEVIKVDNKVYYNPNKGEQLIIKRPSFFK